METTSYVSDEGQRTEGKNNFELTPEGDENSHSQDSMSSYSTYGGSSYSLMSSSILPTDHAGEMVSYKLQELEKKLAGDLFKVRSTYKTFQQAVEDALWPKQSNLTDGHQRMKTSINESISYFSGLKSTLNADLSEAITASGPPHKRVAVLLTLHEIFFSIFHASYIHSAFLCNSNKLIVDNKKRIDLLTLYREIMTYAGTLTVTDMKGVETSINGFIKRLLGIIEKPSEETEPVFLRYAMLTANHLQALVERVKAQNTTYVLDAGLQTNVQRLQFLSLPEINADNDDTLSASKQDIVLSGRFYLNPWTAGSYVYGLWNSYEGTVDAEKSLTQITKQAVQLDQNYIAPLCDQIKNPLGDKKRGTGDFSSDLDRITHAFYEFVTNFHVTKVDEYALECGNHLLGLSSYLHFLSLLKELDQTSSGTSIVAILKEEKELFTMLQEEVNRSEIDKDAVKSYAHIRRFAALTYRETRWEPLENTPSGIFLNSTAEFIHALLFGVLREYQETFLKVTEIEKSSWKEIKRRSDRCIVLKKSSENTSLVTSILSLKSGVLADKVKSFIVKEITNAEKTGTVSPKLDLLLYTLCTDPKYQVILENTRMNDALFSRVCDFYIPQDLILEHRSENADGRRFGTLQYTMGQLRMLNEIMQHLAIAKDIGDIRMYAKADVDFRTIFNRVEGTDPFKVLIENALQKTAKRHGFPQRQKINDTIDSISNPRLESAGADQEIIGLSRPPSNDAFFSIARAIYGTTDIRWASILTLDINDCTEQKIKGGNLLCSELFKNISLEGELHHFDDENEGDTQSRQLKAELKNIFVLSREFEDFVRTKRGFNELQKAVYMAIIDEYREGNKNDQFYQAIKTMKIIDILEHSWGREFVLQWMTDMRTGAQEQPDNDQGE